jgi:hypothetical protein
MKIVINRCYGGFGLSTEAVLRYAELKGITLYAEKDSFLTHFYTVPVEEYKKLAAKADKTRDYSKLNNLYFTYREIERDDPLLVQIVEELGEDSWGDCAELRVVEIPDDVEWEINEYDGMESIAESHRTWR